MSDPERSYRAQNPELYIGGSFQNAINESLSYINTPAPGIRPEDEQGIIDSVDKAREEAQQGIVREPEEGLVYTDYDKLGRYCLSDGTVVFNHQYKTGQLDIGGSHRLVLAQKEKEREDNNIDAGCWFLIYGLATAERPAKRIMYENPSVLIYKHWMSQPDGEWHLGAASRKAGHFTRRINSVEAEELVQVIVELNGPLQAAEDAANTTQLDALSIKLGQLLELSTYERLLASRDKRPIENVYNHRITKVPRWLLDKSGDTSEDSTSSYEQRSS